MIVTSGKQNLLGSRGTMQFSWQIQFERANKRENGKTVLELSVTPRRVLAWERERARETEAAKKH